MNSSEQTAVQAILLQAMRYSERACRDCMHCDTDCDESYSTGAACALSPVISLPVSPSGHCEHWSEKLTPALDTHPAPAQPHPDSGHSDTPRP